MATVLAPAPQQVVLLTRLNRYIQGVTEAVFLKDLGELVRDAEAETAAVLGEALFDGNGWTDRQTTLIQRAIANRTASLALGAAWLQYATGTQEPLLMDPDAIEAAREYFQNEAMRLEGLATSGTESSQKRPFSKPAVGASTFTVGSSDRRPSERNQLLDESDDVSSFDTGRG